MKAIIAIRLYKLKPGTRYQFHELAVKVTVPLLRQHRIKVLDFGPSIHDQDSYYLIRSYDSVSTMEWQEAQFYKSEEWLQGPSGRIVPLVDCYITIVLQRNGLLHHLERSDYPTDQDYHEYARQELSNLNKQFIQNFLNKDAKGHCEIIHPDFVCIESDGSLVERDEYLKNWSTDFENSGYTSFRYEDEVIRIFGNTALVRAKTVYTKDVHGTSIEGYTIYTDTYVREGNEWKCVQVQITPLKK